jgi:hypothetical protein
MFKLTSNLRRETVIRSPRALNNGREPRFYVGTIHQTGGDSHLNFTELTLSIAVLEVWKHTCEFRTWEMQPSLLTTFFYDLRTLPWLANKKLGRCV